MTCPDCTDGFYYPLTGPPETCRTCDGFVGNTPVEVKSQAEKDAIWLKVKSTDLSMWYKDASNLRKQALNNFFIENPVNIFSGLAIETPINRAILGRFFRASSEHNIKKFFQSFNREIYLGDFATFLNEQDERWSREGEDKFLSERLSTARLSRQTLKENGFDPKEL